MRRFRLVTSFFVRGQCAVWLLVSAQVLAITAFASLAAAQSHRALENRALENSGRDSNAQSANRWESPYFAPTPGNRGQGNCGPGGCESDGWGDTCDIWRPGDLLACVRHSVWPPPWLRHSSTDGRNTGRGQPLGGTSWLNRPFHVGWFAGSLWGSDMIDGQVDQKNTFVGGYQFGYDFDHYWGSQLRFGWASPRTQNLTVAEADRTGRLAMFDVDLVYYPWGDSRVRPYFLTGVGLTRVNAADASNTRRTETLLSVPFGIGVKHHFRRWLSVRLELLDNLALARSDFSTMHNISLTTGLEIHLGARPKSYWPWNPSRHIW